ncbi:MAG TPA: hypothetical protein VFM02_03090 [Candidatus Paceibacterota bacterium]|nr:hypothetical protein [Candidatus Paceibacterota bacterium]
MYLNIYNVSEEKKYPLLSSEVRFSDPETIVRSLIAFSVKNPDFGSWLKTLVHTFPESNDIYHSSPFSSGERFFIPNDFSDAQKRAQNFYYFFLAHPKEAELATKLLRGWIEEKPLPLPKLQVIGLIIGWIPGIDFGRLRKKKKMHFVAEKNFYRKQNEVCAAATLQANTEIIRKVLHAANGNQNRLEPEMQDWISGEREMCFYEASRETIHDLVREIRRLPIPYALVKGNHPELLAVSPSINTFALEHFPGIQRRKNTQ